MAPELSETAPEMRPKFTCARTGSVEERVSAMPTRRPYDNFVVKNCMRSMLHPSCGCAASLEGSTDDLRDVDQVHLPPLAVMGRIEDDFPAIGAAPRCGVAAPDALVFGRGIE